jgi:hypothetical protein
VLSNSGANYPGRQKEILSMRRILLAAVALGGLTALTAGGALAAPSAAGLHVAPSQPLVTQADYYYHRRHWHHRRYDHGHWRYW